jgi:uncharacterized protein (TIGR02217 family)
MSFHEVRLDDGLIVYGAAGGPQFSTTVVRVASGAEQRNANWARPLGKWELGERLLTRSELQTLQDFFMARLGRAHGFRWKDHGDYQATTAQGLLGAGTGTGLPTYQLVKRYADAAAGLDRPIRKPVTGSVAVQRGGLPVSFGAAAGNIALDAATGIVSFVADATSAASAITAGATTQVVLAGNPGALVAGERLYLTGFGGADAALVNGLAHTVSVVSGTGPYTFTLSTNTAGKTLTLGSGAGHAYPQATESLTWSGQFDVPVRFDADALSYRFDAADAISGQALFWLYSAPIVEIRA